MAAPNETTAAFLIADLSGYTALTEAHGDRQAADTVLRFVELADACLDPRAVVVERVGDELLVQADEPGPLLRTIVTLRGTIDREPSFPTIRAGIHVGPIVQHEGRFFGATLNLASRIASHARSGQVLCTHPVAEEARRLGHETTTLGVLRFRNVSDPVEIFDVHLPGEAPETALDPVCRMQVLPDAAPAKLSFGDLTYHFCSFDCARAFAATPDRFVS